MTASEADQRRDRLDRTCRVGAGLTMDPVMNDETAGFLSEAPVAHLGFVVDGQPYVIPMAFVVDDGRVLFRTRPGRKLEAIAENPSVCIEACAFDESTGDWQSVIIHGRAAQVTDPAAREHAVTLLLEKYASQVEPPSVISRLQPLASTSHVIEVVIDEVTSTASGMGLPYQTGRGSF